MVDTDELLPETREMILNEPEPLKVVDLEVRAIMKEFKPIFIALKQKYLSVKDLHQLYYNDKTESFERGLKTIYRYVEKLINLGLIIEVGQRMKEGSRAVETLYGPSAHVFFYDSPNISKNFESDSGKEEIEKMGLLVSSLLNQEIDKDKFQRFAIEFQKLRDKKSSELIKRIHKNPELLKIVKSIPSERLSNFIFLTTDLANIWDLYIS